MANERYLLDSHILVWMDQAPERIGLRQRARLDAGLEVYFSAASAWELAIKRNLGKLAMKHVLSVLAEGFGFLELPITAQHAECAAGLPNHHQDPFDRMLVAQALQEDLILATADRRLSLYGANLLLI